MHSTLLIADAGTGKRTIREIPGNVGAIRLESRLHAGLETEVVLDFQAFGRVSRKNGSIASLERFEKRELLTIRMPGKQAYSEVVPLISILEGLPTQGLNAFGIRVRHDGIWA